MPCFFSNFWNRLKRKKAPKTGNRMPEPSKPAASSPLVNRRGLELIKHFESCLEPIGNGMYAAYPDPAHGWSVPTIGWGTIRYPDGSKVARGDKISRQYADELLEWETQEKAAGVREMVTVKLNDDQFSALVSFAYNVGLGALRKSTLLRKLNAGDFVGASAEFPRWNKAGGRELIGLTRRRISEQRLFSGHPDPIVRYEDFRH